MVSSLTPAVSKLQVPHASRVTSAQTILRFSIAVTAEERTEPSSATLFSEATSHKPLRKRHVCDHHRHLNSVVLFSRLLRQVWGKYSWAFVYKAENT